MSSLDPARAVILPVLLGLCIASCHRAAPSGQVVATVNGQEVTNADLTAESRASSDQESAPQLLQKVIARELLAQNAHAQHLDSYPGLPADLARLRSDYLAQLDLKGKVTPPPPPSESAIAQFITSHPYLFADRSKLTVDAVRFHAADDLRSLGGLDSVEQVVGRLKQLNVQFQRKQEQLDTAAIPSDLGAKLLSTPPGELVILQQPDTSIALQIQARQPVSQTSDQQKAEARQFLLQVAEKAEIQKTIAKLRASAHIDYQPGYQPMAPAKTTHPAA